MCECRKNILKFKKEMLFGFNVFGEPGFDVCDIRYGVELTSLLCFRYQVAVQVHVHFVVEIRCYLFKQFMRSGVRMYAADVRNFTIYFDCTHELLECTSSSSPPRGNIG